MNYTFNCKNCVNRLMIADNNGFFHEFCKAIREDKKRPFRYYKLDKKISCVEYKEETT